MCTENSWMHFNCFTYLKSLDPEPNFYTILVSSGKVNFTIAWDQRVKIPRLPKLPGALIWICPILWLCSPVKVGTRYISFSYESYKISHPSFKKDNPPPPQILFLFSNHTRTSLVPVYLRNIVIFLTLIRSYLFLWSLVSSSSHNFVSVGLK